MNLYPNEGVFLFGLVEAFTGLVFLVALFFIHKLNQEKRMLSIAQRSNAGLAACILIATLISIRLYLELPQHGFSTLMVDLPSFVFVMMIIFQRISQKKISYEGTILAVVGVSYIIHGIRGLFV